MGLNTDQTVHQIAAYLTARHATLITAESCTGGLLAARLTATAGSSAWFEGSLVTYRLSAKQHLLGIQALTLTRFGAVSKIVAEQMAAGALHNSDANYSISITGFAGPGEGTPAAPTGTVWIAWLSRDNEFKETKCYRFTGSREAVREQAVDSALHRLAQLLGCNDGNK